MLLHHLKIKLQFPGCIFVYTKCRIRLTNDCQPQETRFFRCRAFKIGYKKTSITIAKRLKSGINLHPGRNSIFNSKLAENKPTHDAQENILFRFGAYFPKFFFPKHYDAGPAMETGAGWCKRNV
jgi:hypothetical protein